MKILSLENLFKLLIVIAGTSFLIFICNIFDSNVNTHRPTVNPTIAHTEQQNKLETYTYKITKIDPSGYYGDSTTDQTGIYFVNENIPKGTTINQGDTVKVSFPLNSYEEITHIEVLEN